MTYCPNCKTFPGAPEWKARATILSANKSGRTVRIFCEACGQITDIYINRYGQQQVTRVVTAARGKPLVNVLSTEADK